MMEKNRFEEILSRIKKIEEILSRLIKSEKEEFIDNQDFLHLMKITARTAQKWRDTGVIGYSLICGKVYYKKEEIILLLRNSYKKKHPKAH